MEEVIGFGFIGAGSVAYLHASAIAARADARLVCVYDAREEQAQLLAQEFGCRVSSTIEELLSDPDVQAVSVLSPLEFHREHASLALDAGKHVLLEKPVTATLADVQYLEQKARTSGKVCMPAHNYIYAPELRRARRLIASNTFGKVVSAWIIYTLHHPREVAAKYPGVLRQIMIHHFYSLLYLLGKPLCLTALASETRSIEEMLQREDQVALLLKMPGGALVNLFASFATDDQTSEPWTVTYKILGTEGGSVYSWRDAVVMSPRAGLSWRYIAYEESFQHEIEYFIQHCIRNGEEPLSTLQDAVDAQLLLESTEEALQKGVTVNLVWDH
ncbi:oxidoreductase [Reticulibacter mediterranei]|uniref:Oxidoreductase n=1 Tax=Reticulibacter mediterranei TaxID=2778369 RepID=A0A8J3I9Y6_9CHLR|nr:Gfo/Idh/MocA family oxidoreductase [Reticulibacter mediterranei]GHO90611.1 oxidoreductase [Reticulibacter mediterranei]